MDEGGRDVPSKYAVQDAQVNLISKELPFLFTFLVFGLGNEMEMILPSASVNFGLPKRRKTTLGNPCNLEWTDTRCLLWKRRGLKWSGGHRSEF